MAACGECNVFVVLYGNASIIIVPHDPHIQVCCHSLNVHRDATRKIPRSPYITTNQDGTTYPDFQVIYEGFIGLASYQCLSLSYNVGCVCLGVLIGDGIGSLTDCPAGC